jgi:hypothetical protein
MIDPVYFRQAELLLRVLPLVDRVYRRLLFACFFSQ